MANKCVKQELKEQNRAFDKRVVSYEKKISELNEFRSRKLNEEREERTSVAEKGMVGRISFFASIDFYLFSSFHIPLF